jgi:hypothetical protein
MDAALHDDYWDAAEKTGNDTAGVALDGRLREVWDFSVRNRDWIGHSVGNSAQAGAEHDSDARSERAEPGSKELGGCRDLIEVGHGWGERCASGDFTGSARTLEQAMME